jgi:hypothetical protein
LSAVAANCKHGQSIEKQLQTLIDMDIMKKAINYAFNDSFDS